ncbi:MAG: TrkH family potassium uptake protein [Coriobacteriia bacterium]|nr:TrkH family potassium uptake protein [Coriobacteriia bacterium]
MWARFYIKDLRIIAHYLGIMVIFTALIMTIPLLVSLVMQEWETSAHYVFSIGLTLMAGAVLRLAKVNTGHMERRHAIAVTGLIWIIGALFAALPLWLSGHYGSYLDAFFEGVSGLTATGLTLVQDLDHMSTADNMWRFILQFLGGQGIVVVAMALGLFTQVGSSFFNAEGRQEAVLPSIAKTARFIWVFSSTIVLVGTLILTGLLLVTGMEPIRSFFHGLWLTIGSYDTGGFAPQSSSVMYYHSWPLEIVAMFFMCLGAINFALYARVQQGHWREFIKDLEVRTLGLWTLGMIAAFVVALGAGHILADYLPLLRRGLFTIISATTNSGYQILTTNQLTTILTSGAFFLVAIAMAIGGSAGSTAGGIKALRVGLIFKGFVLRIKGVLLPRSAQINTRYTHIGQHLLSNELLSSALIIAALYTITYVFGALAGIACGYEAIPSIFESISATSNAGLSSGIVNPEAPVILKIVYILQMWMGRLEFLTLLALGASLLLSLRPHRRITQQQRTPGTRRQGRGDA